MSDLLPDASQLLSRARFSEASLRLCAQLLQWPVRPINTSAYLRVEIVSLRSSGQVTSIRLHFTCYLAQDSSGVHVNALCLHSQLHMN